MIRVKIYYIDEELREIEVSEKMSAMDIALDIFRNHKDLKITHFLVEHDGKWLYGNDYELRRKK